MVHGPNMSGGPIAKLALILVYTTYYPFSLLIVIKARHQVVATIECKFPRSKVTFKNNITWECNWFVDVFYCLKF